MSKVAEEAKVTEKLLTHIWSRQLLKKDNLLTAEGKKLQVIYPGRPNNDSGPDFLDAVLVIDGVGMLQGDIELHVRARDWQSHGHHQDRNYDGVILHAVMWEDAHRPAGILRNGRGVEVLPMHRCLGRPVHELQELMQQETLLVQPCARSLEILGDEMGILEEAGEKRFLSKAEQFESELAAGEQAQVLYEGFMGALGYTKNKKPFRELGRILPLSSIEHEAGRVKSQDRPILIQSLLLGTAGMLPGQRQIAATEKWVQVLEDTWQQFGAGTSMAIGQWSFFRTRPENHPVRRAAGASYLLHKYYDEGFFYGMLRLVSEAQPDGHRGEMEQELTAPSQGFWSRYFDFGIPSKRNLALIGQGRSREVVVNILLPFFFAWSRVSGQSWLEDHTLELYHRWPRLQENWITRYMESQIFGQNRPRMVNSACRQQGLIHLYRNRCIKLQCGECPLHYR